MANARRVMRFQLRMVSCLRLCLAGWLLVTFSPARAAEPFWFNTLVAHWTDYGTPEYLDFIGEAKPQVAQVGFYGVTFYSVAHTPFGKGYPAHFPVQGTKECGEFFRKLNQEVHARGTKVVGHFNTTFILGDPEKRARAIGEATTHYMDDDVLARVSAGLGEAMVGISTASLEPSQLLETAAGADAVTATSRAYAALAGMVYRQASIVSFVGLFQFLGVVFFVVVPSL